MKRKHRDAMIAMGIKIAAIEKLHRNHGEAHWAIGVLPQFTNLFKRVEEIEKRMVQIDIHRDRLNDHDESIEALSETVDQLSTCKCEAGNQMLKRIAELEKHQQQLNASDNIDRICKRLNALEKAKEDDVFPARGRLQLVTEKVSDLERAVYNSPFSKIVMEEYAENIKRLVRDVDTLKIQMHNLLPVHNNMMDEVLKQKAFLSKVQAILDRERDARIVKSPGYKKEVAAMRMDANAPKDAKGQSGFSMDKHVDMMVKKGRPRKP